VVQTRAAKGKESLNLDLNFRLISTYSHMAVKTLNPAVKINPHEDDTCTDTKIKTLHRTPVPATATFLTFAFMCTVHVTLSNTAHSHIPNINIRGFGEKMDMMNN
jgi:hypothetical protein